MLHLRPDTLLPKRLDFDLTVNIGDAPVTVGKLSYIREDVLEDMVQQRVKEAIEAGERQNFNCRCVVPKPKPEPQSVLTLDEVENYVCVIEQKGWGMSGCEVVCRSHDPKTGVYVLERLDGKDRKNLYAGDYGITWRCWDHMPTAEERAAHPWKEAT